MNRSRRVFIRNTVIGIGLTGLFPARIILAGSGCGLQHPFMPPKMDLVGQCHNCGMQRPMWARTWHTFELADQAKEVCSIHCLAEITHNAGMMAENIQVANYLEPQKFIPVEQAVYLIGSNARGTMSPVSKLAFASKTDAAEFSKDCGGKLAGFSEAYEVALQSVAKDNSMIHKNRVKKGKIVEPVAGKDICPVCGMDVAKYPHNKCQIQTSKGETLHFCATQCLFEFLKNHDKYEHPKLDATYLWVVDYETHQWIYGRNSYYVVGAKESGPMGKEAFPFVNLMSADNFAKKYGGKVLRFNEVSIDKILI